MIKRSNDLRINEENHVQKQYRKGVTFDQCSIDYRSAYRISQQRYIKIKRKILIVRPPRRGDKNFKLDVPNRYAIFTKKK